MNALRVRSGKHITNIHDTDYMEKLTNMNKTNTVFESDEGYGEMYRRYTSLSCENIQSRPPIIYMYMSKDSMYTVPMRQAYQGNFKYPANWYSHPMFTECWKMTN